MRYSNLVAQKQEDESKQICVRQIADVLYYLIYYKELSDYFIKI